MSQDTSELVVASGGDIFVAPVGATIPTSPTTALAAEWVQLGLIDDDGAKFTRSITLQEFKAWQRRLPVRRDVSEEEMTATFSLEQWNAENFAFAFGGGEVVEASPGVFKYEFPTGDDSLDEKALVIRWNDGDRNYQIAFDRGNVTEQVEVGLKRSDLAQLPIGYKALAAPGSDAIGVTFLTDDAAFTPAGS